MFFSLSLEKILDVLRISESAIICKSNRLILKCNDVSTTS